MLRKLPIIGSSARLGDIIFALRNSGDKQVRAEFKNMLSVITGAHNIYPVDSGIAAFYITLKALTKISQKREVILPAYTAGSLIVAIRKAGLKPVLCDISLEDFNMDAAALSGKISAQTLAVVAVHMFGIGMRGIENLRAALPENVYLIEDCCQAMGAVAGGRTVGAFGDASFFSFNRGKNLPLCGGGFISTEDIFIARAIEDQMREITEISALRELLMPMKALAFFFGTNPYIYSAGYALASRFKEAVPPNDIKISEMSSFQVALGTRLIKRMEELAGKRYNNGAYLLRRLSSSDGIVLPKIADGARPAFSRLPVLFRDLDRRRLAEDMLARAGIEASRMYMRPLHHMFDLGYERSEFPNADYLAQRLLTLPVHPMVRKRDLDRMVGAISGALK